MSLKTNFDPLFNYDMGNTTDMDQVLHQQKHLTLLSDIKNNNYTRNDKNYT